jgi:hypothetical protein
MWPTELNTPKTFSNHRTTAITTTALRIDLIEAAMGINRLTSQSKTPTTINVRIMLIKGIADLP